MAMLVAASLTVGACGKDREPLGPTATLPRGTTTTNPYAVPPVIDEAYVNRVLSGLDHSVGDIVRLIVSAGTISPEAVERLKAFYVGRALQLQVDSFQKDEFEQFRGYKENPGDQITTVAQVIDGKPECIYARVTIDFSAVSRQPDPTFSTQWVVLLPSDPAKDPMRYNPTGWTFLYEGFNQDLSAPPNLCAGT
jgi:hypothetical protein